MPRTRAKPRIVPGAFLLHRRVCSVVLGGKQRDPPESATGPGSQSWPAPQGFHSVPTSRPCREARPAERLPPQRCTLSRSPGPCLLRAWRPARVERDVV